METYYPEIHNFHCEMDIELKPSLTEANVQTHTILLDIMEKCRRLRPEDCCKYCAVYSNNLTSVQHKEIEKWRQDVNNAINSSKRITKPKRKSAKDSNYRPPGKPDETEGFRRIPIPKPSASRSTARKSSRRSHVSREKNGINATNSCKRHQSGIAAKDSDNNTEAVNSDSVEIISLNSNNQDQDMYAIRSSSNDLLNVMTIDDCKIVHDHRKAGMDLHQHSTEDMNGKEKAFEDRGVRFKTSSVSAMPSQKSPLPPIEQQTPDSDDEYFDLLTEPNETVIKALDNIIHNKKVTYNTAKRGLFKYDKGYKPMSECTYESDRFRKLNDKLHKVMEEKYLVNPRTRNRIQRYYSKHKNSESGDMSNEKVRKLRVTTPEISKNRQQSRLESLSTTDNKAQHDSFLGMLMDMDTGNKMKKEAT